MHHPLLRVLALAGLLALAPTVMVRAQEAQTSAQRRALDDAAADRLIRKDLLSVLRPLPGGFGGGNLRRIPGQTLFTRAYGTNFVNLCRTDLLTVRYASTDAGEHYEHSPIAPYGLEVETWFHLSGDAREKTASPRDHHVWDQACERLAPETYVGWFAAPSERDAAIAGNLLKATVDLVRSGRLAPGPCEGLFDEKKSCAQVVLDEASRIDRISGVRICQAPAGQACYRIDMASSTGLTIIFTLKPDAIVPAAIESVAVEQYIVIT